MRAIRTLIVPIISILCSVFLFRGYKGTEIYFQPYKFLWYKYIPFMQIGSLDFPQSLLQKEM